MKKNKKIDKKMRKKSNIKKNLHKKKILKKKIIKGKIRKKKQDARFLSLLRAAAAKIKGDFLLRI